MRKSSFSESGLFNPRIFSAFILCSAGMLLAMLSFAAPTLPSETAASSPDTFKPVVINSVSNGTSSSLRDLPRAASTESGEIGDDLPPIRPNHPVPAGFVDAALQSVAAAAAAPTPNVTFEGQGSVDSGGSPAGCTCAPPDTNGAVGPTQYVQ